MLNKVCDRKQTFFDYKDKFFQFPKNRIFKISFSTRTSLNLISSPFFDRKQIKKKIAYFDQKVNPLQK